MAYRFITADTVDAVTTLAIARPDKLNALTPNVFAELNTAIDASLDEGARAIVLTGEGRAFSSGADLMPDGAGYEGLPEDLGDILEQHYNPFILRLMALPVPVITAMNGPAVGAGLALALAGDVVVAARSAYLLLAFVNIGLVPDAGATWLVARSAGRARAMEMALLGEKMTAADAQTIGLVTRVVDDETVLAEAQSIAARLAKGAGKAIGMIRAQVNHAVDASLVDVLTNECVNQRKAGFTEDFREALAAFGEKRVPVFKGR
ncbi:enoyl-CoA hydratase-related protein [Croceicoccus sp. F390]|uniref:Enoyl-CoA hydratase-related protein n=1 Tax=Croceicoccus esteveae TaxID=3075597 RepID=A0ABU2ZI07_9SPHN|nr:enoyl-CoA hydratase-related protein [Croceicoccus sp. F390]MDT0575219.1 enoyl-CoA hydratase-related protein [Croceicoccus sp. F390]